MPFFTIGEAARLLKKAAAAVAERTDHYRVTLRITYSLVGLEVFAFMPESVRIERFSELDGGEVGSLSCDAC